MEKLYVASILSDKTGKEMRLFPRSKKTSLFTSENAACSSIEIWGRRGLTGQGRVYNAKSKELIWTIAV